ncbi:MAG: porin family protein [Gammaproteobacteria bacterium]|nr:porin family protein [Gammaproteobacteria bacterium]MDH5344134.1 porin family protein [Gammaproteobacteria bacterium]
MQRTIALLIFMLLPVLASAQNYGNKWEWSVAGIYQESGSTGTVGGSSLEIDSAVGLGFSFNYFFNPRLMLGADFEWLSPDYRATLLDDQGMTSVIDHELTQFNGRIKGTYNFIDGPLSPFIEAGFGWTYVDSNVADGPPIVGCWWHPWWGYICDGYYDTFNETSFSYGGALGVRYRLRGGTVLKLSYNNWEIDGSGEAPDPTLNAFRLEAAWGF